MTKYTYFKNKINFCLNVGTLISVVWAFCPFSYYKKTIIL